MNGEKKREKHDVYLGDGLYGRRELDGAIVLTAPRGDVDHYVVLEPNVLAAFENWIAEGRRSK